MMDLVSFFESIKDNSYSVIKIKDTFPTYSVGDDIDIFCYSPEEIARKAIQWGRDYVQNGIEIKVDNDAKYRHIYVDFMENDTIHLRFDLYGQLPYYKKLSIKPAMFESIIEHSRIICGEYHNKSFNVKVPSEIDELILRYIEFIEWYNIRPDKIRHLDYILNKLKDKQQIKFIDKLHHYTALPGYEEYWKNEKPNRQNIFQRTIARVKGKSFREIVIAVLSKIPRSAARWYETVKNRLCM